MGKRLKFLLYTLALAMIITSATHIRELWATTWYKNTMVMQSLDIMLNDMGLGFNRADFAELASTPATPSTGQGTIYFKDDGIAYGLDDNGAETSLMGAGGGGGDVSKVGTTTADQVGVWTGDGTIEGTAGLTYDGLNFLVIGDVGSTGARITKGWFTNVDVDGDVLITNGHFLHVRNTDTGIHSHNANELNIESIGTNGTIFFDATNDVIFRDEADNEKMRFETDTGNVGIGTDTPRTPLHIKIGAGSGGIEAGQGLFVERDGPSTITLSSPTLGTWAFGDAADADVGHIGYSHSSNNMFFVVNTIEALRLQNDGDVQIMNGNVGIGTIVPTEKLQVKDGNIEVYDTGDLGSESLNEIDFATHANWDTVGDFDDTGGNATYTHSGGTGTLTQTSANMAVAGVGSRWYVFTYTISSSSGDAAVVITTAFASATTGLVVTDGAQTAMFQSTASPGDFVLSATSTSGGFTLDDVSLKEVQGGDVIVNGLITGGGATGIKVTGAGNVGINTAVPNSTLDVAGGVSMSVVAKTANYTATITDHTITCGAGNETFTVTLLPAATAFNSTDNTGLVYDIINVGSGVITIDADGIEDINGTDTQTLNTQYDSVTIQSDGTEWWIL
jgi:hypothetical protein